MDGMTAVERLTENQLRWLEAEWRDTNSVSLPVQADAMRRLAGLMMWEDAREPGGELAEELTCLTNVARAKFDVREG